MSGSHHLPLKHAEFPHPVVKKSIPIHSTIVKPSAKQINAHLFEGMVMSAVGRMKMSSFNISKAITSGGGLYSFGITKKV